MNKLSQDVIDFQQGALAASFAVADLLDRQGFFWTYLWFEQGNIFLLASEVKLSCLPSSANGCTANGVRVQHYKTSLILSRQLNLPYRNIPDDILQCINKLACIAIASKFLSFQNLQKNRNEQPKVHLLPAWLWALVQSADHFMKPYHAFLGLTTT